MIDYTPELHKQALEIAKQYVMGPLFTPPTLQSAEPGGTKGTAALPSDWGAGNWNTGAFDPETGMYYAVSTTQPVILALIKAYRSERDHGLLGTRRRWWRWES